MEVLKGKQAPFGVPSVVVHTVYYKPDKLGNLLQ